MFDMVNCFYRNFCRMNDYDGLWYVVVFYERYIVFMYIVKYLDKICGFDLILWIDIDWLWLFLKYVFF